MKRNHKKANIYRIPNFLELDNIFSSRKRKLQKITKKNVLNYLIKALADTEGNTCT